MSIQFPEKLKPFENKLLKSKTTAVVLSFQDGSKLEPWQSKIGGMPFLPSGAEYPQTPEGKYMYLLAQINFEELPQAVETLPRKGLLQFYLADDDSYGVNYDNPTQQDKFRVLFFPEINKQDYQRDLPRLETPKHFPIIEPFTASAITFSIQEELVGFSDYRIMQFLGGSYEVFENTLYENPDEYEWFFTNFDLLLEKDKIGGYATFFQEDPRRYDENLQKYDFLLLQIGSNEIMQWGDMGGANFFINSQKLKQQDFSDILYNWDCA